MKSWEYLGEGKKFCCMQVVLGPAEFLVEEIFIVLFHKKAVNIFTIKMLKRGCFFPRE